MAIRSIAHAIQSGETSLGWAIGAESMSLKYVVSLHSNVTCINFLVCSPRPTPEVAEIVGKNQHAYDCIQVSSTMRDTI